MAVSLPEFLGRRAIIRRVLTAARLQDVFND
jgi:hypothetical protein